jgi:hypothetical protein
MKYVPIWVPVILILGLVGVGLYRPLPVDDTDGAPRAPSHRTVGSARTPAALSGRSPDTFPRAAKKGSLVGCACVELHTLTAPRMALTSP